ncbi:hypothetical protein [Candidatus Nitrosocosmicus hydrocola]|uniref:hypothetical protein n=1 Tax=Candidatus Nitrosocosmicus hydrocola TaxID=1826872 RepID=UPI0011E5924D|nr:hypothetical protein [Candidatus Nitrosocosmicus hydrocola]
MSDDIFSSNDWMKIKIKFSGSCLKCKQKINAGDVGYWSRSAKSILHDDCYLTFMKIDQTDHLEANRGNNRKRIESRIDYNTAATTLTGYKTDLCFICNNPVDLHDPLIVELIHIEDKDGQSRSHYCALCLKEFNSRIFEDYKISFNRKIKR